MVIKKYIKLFFFLCKLSLDKVLSYRRDYIIGVLASLVYMVVYLSYMNILLIKTNGLAGWSIDMVLILFGVGQLWTAIYYVFIYSGSKVFIETLFNGKFDFILLKPLNERFLIFTSKIDIQTLVLCLEGVCVITYALLRLHYMPSIKDILLFIIVFSIGIHITIGLQTIINSFYLFFLNNSTLFYILSDFNDASKFPYQIYPKIFIYILLFIVPTIIFVSLPAKALMGMLDIKFVFVAMFIDIFIYFIAKYIWKKGLSRYASIGG